MRAQAWIWCLALTAVVGRSSAQPAPSAPEPPPAKATLADVAFIAGHWTGDMGGSLSEEVWSAPSGDNMMGMWRLVAGGQVKLFEFLNIVMEDDGPVFRLRHFDRKGVGWEDKDKPVVLKLVSWKPREAVFKGRDSANTGDVQLHYRRTAQDRLSVTLEKTGAAPQEFTFRLASSIR